jgi:hypothetical protein
MPVLAPVIHAVRQRAAMVFVIPCVEGGLGRHLEPEVSTHSIPLSPRRRAIALTPNRIALPPSREEDRGRTMRPSRFANPANGWAVDGCVRLQCIAVEGRLMEGGF